MIARLALGFLRCWAGSDQVALVPRQYGEALRERLGIETYAPPMPVAAALLCIIWHRQATNGAAHRWLRDTIAAIFLTINEGEASLPSP